MVIRIRVEVPDTFRQNLYSQARTKAGLATRDAVEMALVMHLDKYVDSVAEGRDGEEEEEAGEP